MTNKLKGTDLDGVLSSIVEACSNGKSSPERAGEPAKPVEGAHAAASPHLESHAPRNRRKWRSEAHAGANGLTVVTAKHPSIADWTNPDTDPSGLVRFALAR